MDERIKISGKELIELASKLPKKEYIPTKAQLETMEEFELLVKSKNINTVDKLKHLEKYGTLQNYKK